MTVSTSSEESFKSCSMEVDGSADNESVSMDEYVVLCFPLFCFCENFCSNDLTSIKKLVVNLKFFLIVIIFFVFQGKRRTTDDRTKFRNISTSKTTSNIYVPLSQILLFLFCIKLCSD